MRYCLSAGLKHLKPEEIKCAYNRLGDIYDYMREHPDDVRYIILYPLTEVEDVLLQQLNFVKATVKDFSISCSNILVLKKLLKEGYPTFLTYPAADWETFDNLLRLGVTDVLIDGALGFSMPKLRKAKEKSERKFYIRVAPTVSANSVTAPEITASSFFIRPEDAWMYKDIVDCFDFCVDSAETEEVLYNIYKRESFINEINLLVKHLNASVPNALIGPEFAKYRFDCGQSCKVPGGRCHYCETHMRFVDKSTEYFKKS